MYCSCRAAANSATERSKSMHGAAAAPDHDADQCSAWSSHKECMIPGRTGCRTRVRSVHARAADPGAVRAAWAGCWAVRCGACGLRAARVRACGAIGNHRQSHRINTRVQGPTGGPTDSWPLRSSLCSHARTHATQGPKAEPSRASCIRSVDLSPAPRPPPTGPSTMPYTYEPVPGLFKVTTWEENVSRPPPRWAAAVACGVSRLRARPRSPPESGARRSRRPTASQTPRELAGSGANLEHQLTAQIVNSFGLQLPSWAAFCRRIEQLAAEGNGDIKVVYCARHGEAEHNVLSRKYGCTETEAQTVSVRSEPPEPPAPPAPRGSCGPTSAVSGLVRRVPRAASTRPAHTDMSDARDARDARRGTPSTGRRCAAGQRACMAPAGTETETTSTSSADGSCTRSRTRC